MPSQADFQAWHELASPLLYYRVQTHDLCHLLAGTAKTAVPGLKSKRDLIDAVEYLVLLYPKNNQLRSYISATKLEALFPDLDAEGARKKLMNDAKLRSKLATESLEEAVVFPRDGRDGKGDKEGGAKTDRGGKRLTQEADGDETGKQDADDKDRGALEEEDEGAEEGESYKLPFGLDKGQPAFASLVHLSIGSGGPRSISKRPDARSKDALNIICPRNVCCYFSAKDTLGAKADPYFFPGNLVLHPHWEIGGKDIKTGTFEPFHPVDHLEQLTVHVDASYTAGHATLRPLPGAFGRPCIYMIDASQATQHDFAAEELVCEIIGQMTLSPMSKLHFIVKMPKPTNKNIQWQWESIDEFFGKRHLDIFEELGYSDDEDQEGVGNKHKAFAKLVRKNTSFKWDLVEEFPLCQSCGQGSPEPINQKWYPWGSA